MPDPPVTFVAQEAPDLKGLMVVIDAEFPAVLLLAAIDGANAVLFTEESLVLS